MCGIVGLFIKNPELEPRLGALLAPMLVEMSDRGPDSAGVAVYRRDAGDRRNKLTVLAESEVDWAELEHALQTAFGKDVGVRPRVNHAVLSTAVDPSTLRDWLAIHRPRLRPTSSGTAIEIYKEKGLPREFVERFALTELGGTHALGHTRMATESAVTTEHSHPFSTGLDLCLVHNGSLSNHNLWRRQLRRYGVPFQTDNDSEVAAGYLMWRLQQGDDLEQALERALVDLDGFYTFAVGTRDGFAVLRDAFGCKPAVMAETEDWAAMASEFRAIATLPGAEQATIREPEPACIYSWRRSEVVHA